ncbi:hypothetical protein [Pantoea agglomerans]|uniref:hypothetical protein n=1 Tax=Enterobacter agglomerans TaxID=549 RepID=UPI001141029E|nr:hypothetical protein [Pantoea agglomerans]
MATTTCPKCPSTRFEVKEHPIAGCNFRMLFIQCATCGAAVGVTETIHTNTLIRNLARKLGFTL